MVKIPEGTGIFTWDPSSSNSGKVLYVSWALTLAWLDRSPQNHSCRSFVLGSTAFSEAGNRNASSPSLLWNEYQIPGKAV